MKIHEIIDEAFDKPYPITLIKDPDPSQYDFGGGDYSGITTLSDGTTLEVNFFDDDTGGDTYQVEFRRGGSQELTGRGDSQRVFATVLSAIKQLIELADPYMISFAASKDSGKDSSSRTDLYSRMAKRYAAKWGYNVYTEDHGDALIFELVKIANENFADGKVKGKSRPGRVKRAGASCKGSVTDLRAKAKKYSGERGKMYHWCANMKSGKQKK